MKLPLIMAILAFTTVATAQDGQPAANAPTTVQSSSAIGAPVTVTPSNETRIRIVSPEGEEGRIRSFPPPPSRPGALGGLARLRAEVVRLQASDSDLAALQAGLEDPKETADLSPEDVKTRQRIIELRRELHVLEKRDILVRTRKAVDNALAVLPPATTAPASGAETTYTNESVPSGRMRAQLEELRAATTSFDALAEAFARMPGRLEGPGRFIPPDTQDSQPARRRDRREAPPRPETQQ